MSPSPTRLQFFKYDGTEHWGADVQLLGEDEHGLWLGVPSKTRYGRPGHTDYSSPRHVVLVPENDWWIATFNSEPAGQSGTITVYVDITTPPTIADGEVFAVDLDLDVIRRTTGVVEIVDEDEFADHQLTMAYPAQVVTAAREAADRLLAQVRDEAAPFDGSHAPWLARVR